MRVRARIDKNLDAVEIQVCSSELTPQVKALVEEISAFVNEGIAGTDSRGEKVVIPLREILRFYTENQKVIVQDTKGTYVIQEKLYELEEQLDEEQFFRIAKSEIVNLKKIRRLDMSITGTIKVILSDGTETYTSRRNVTKLKQRLGIKG
jgi:DNA-binding LytR/AlgR family response regulator